jgi:ABC-type multidrug transport system ATPase subunit
MNKAILSENISKNFGEVHALNDVSLDVNRGEIFGLIGPDGAGKTTLFRIITTLMLPDKGRMTVLGLDVVTGYKSLRRKIGYMPGRFSLYQDLSVEENLHFYATVFGTSVRENYDLIADIYSHIEPFKKRLAGKLSGGMKQKLALSCALIHKPDLLVLDEPTTGVDAVSRKEFWEMLKQLQQRGITILVSTPYMDEATLCDRVALIQDGKIMDVDTPRSITEKFPHRIFQVRSDEMFRLITDLRNFQKAGSVFAFGQFVHFTGIDDNVERIELDNYLDNLNHRNVLVEEIAPGIEDVFIHLMKSRGKNGSHHGHPAINMQSLRDCTHPGNDQIFND